MIEALHEGQKTGVFLYESDKTNFIPERDIAALAFKNEQFVPAPNIKPKTRGFGDIPHVRT